MKTPTRFSVILPILAAAICNLGCTTTITPVKVQEAQASFDGNEQNSGFLGWTNHYGVLTTHAHGRYQNLVTLYGDRFSPRLAGDVGTSPYTNGTYLIDKEHLVDFGKMSLWKRSGVK